MFTKGAGCVFLNTLSESENIERMLSCNLEVCLSALYTVSVSENLIKFDIRLHAVLFSELNIKPHQSTYLDYKKGQRELL
jgi:hypothetical protein